MSIDHGKLLVACRRKLEAYRDAYGLEYVGGQELSSLLADIDRALAQPAEAEECGACAAGCKDGCRLAKESPSLLYEHADDGIRIYGYPVQPAEAVEDITDLVMQPGAVCPTCCQTLHVDTDSDDLLQEKAHADEGWRLAHEWMRRAQAAEAANDAAQGVVAWHLESKVVKNGCATRDLWWSEPGAGIRETFNVRPLIFGDTHPQAAPAQGDVASRFIGFVSVHWRDDLARDDVVSVSATLDGSHSLPVYLSAAPSPDPRS